jgi:hypothetical protein
MYFFTHYECNSLNIYQSERISIWKLQRRMKHVYYVQCSFTANMKMIKQNKETCQNCVYTFQMYLLYIYIYVDNLNTI